MRISGLKSILYFLALLAFSSCGEDDAPSPGNIVDDGSVIRFDQVLGLVNLQLDDSTYIVSESIDSIRVYINNELWSICNSNSINNSGINNDTLNDLRLSNSKLNYLFIADQNATNEIPEFNTVGDYADYINAINVLKAGEYILMIESLQYKDVNGNSIKVYPYKYAHFELDENTKSAYVGELNIKI